MKVLLDEMYPASIAVQLRERGHDVVSVHEAGWRWLEGMSDPSLFAAVVAAERTVVTENVRDFMPLHQRWLTDSRHHYGLVFTTNDKYPRHRPQHAIGRLVGALGELLQHTTTHDDQATWL